MENKTSKADDYKTEIFEMIGEYLKELDANKVKFSQKEKDKMKINQLCEALKSIYEYFKGSNDKKQEAVHISATTNNCNKYTIMENELKIEVPQGYEIGKQKSTFEKIIFKKIPENPKTWEEYCSLMKGKTAHQTNCDNYIIINSFPDAHDMFATKERAEQFIALGKLLQLRDYWVKGYDGFRYALFCTKVGISIFESSGFSSYTLTFPTRKMAIEFKNCFSDLIKKAYPLV